MSRHVIDTDHSAETGLRLRRFVTIARQGGRHPAILRLLRQPRSRTGTGARLAGMLRAGRDQARTSFS